MKVFIGYDHRGVNMAYKVMEYLLSSGHEVNEPFLNNDEADDYPDISHVVCEKVKKNKGSIGILICGTGIGMNMCANKESKIRAVLAHSEAEAYFSRRHENANVLVLAAGYDDGKMQVKAQNSKAEKIIETFINTQFEGDRHVRRINKMEDILKSNLRF